MTMLWRRFTCILKIFLCEHHCSFFSIRVVKKLFPYGVAAVSYVYAVARLRGMENRLLDASFLTRLMDSPTLDDALKALAETSYAQWLGKADETGFDKVIDNAMLATCGELGQFVPDSALLTLFRMPYDYHNVKEIGRAHV